MTRAESLARLWIECWNQSRPDDIPLAENFVHTSPFGRVEGRVVYLEWVKPLAAQNVAQLDIQRSMGTEDEAVVHFEMTTPTGVWTDKGSKIFQMSSQMRAGVIWANTFNKFDPTAPFGGYKESGVGREGGLHGLDAYVELGRRGARR